MDSLPKIIDLLKASGWQTGALSVGACLFIWAAREGHLPPVDPAWLITAYAVAITMGMLCLASIGTKLQEWSTFGVRVAHRAWRRRKEKRRFIAYIPTLTAKERQILGYLREKQERNIETDQSGDYANGLIAHGFMHFIGAQGQAFRHDGFIATVPDHVWEVIIEQPAEFPYTPEYSNDARHGRARVEVHPWRVPWQLR